VTPEAPAQEDEDSSLHLELDGPSDQPLQDPTTESPMLLGGPEEASTAQTAQTQEPISAVFELELKDEDQPVSDIDATDPLSGATDNIGLSQPDEIYETALEESTVAALSGTAASEIDATNITAESESFEPLETDIETSATDEFVLFDSGEDIDDDFYDEDFGSSAGLGGQSIADDDIEDFPVLDSAAYQDFDPAVDFADVAQALETTPAEQDLPGPTDSIPVSVVQEPLDDIFGGDLELEFTDEHSSEDADEEALFASLSLGETAFDEVVEVDAIEEIASAAFVEQTLDSGQSTPATIVSATDQSTEAAVPSPESAPEVAPEPAPEPDSVEETSWCVPNHIEFNYTSASGSEIVKEFLDAFVEEAATELEKLEDGIAQWEQSYDGGGPPNTVLRTLHTLKGIAKSVGLQRYGTLMHNFETLLEQLELPAVGAQDDYLRVVNAWLNAAVQGFEYIETTQRDIASELPKPSAAPAEITEGLATAVSEPKTAPDQPPADVEPTSESLPATAGQEPATTLEPPARPETRQVSTAEKDVKTPASQETIRMTAEAVDHLMNLTNQAQQLGVRSSQSTVRSKLATSELQARLSSVRTNVNQIADKALLSVTAQGGARTEKLDALEMDQYSEIQEAANILREGVEDLNELIAQTNRQNTLVEALLKQQASVIASLRGSIQAARVIPVSRLMPGLRRIIRTASSDLGKSVNFRVLQEVGSLDRDSHARCQVILEHMVRNALDHGIETPEQRASAGKPPSGLITIDVGKDGGDYVITLMDDGRGMDPAVLRDVAIKRGLNIDLETLSDEEVLKLIFTRGFSTASKVSEISGRGVGMDIVMSEIQQLGGDINISSELGRGTTFSIRIPANLTVNGALLVTAAEQSYAIPLDGLIAIEHVPVEDFFEAASQNTSLSLLGLDCEPTYLATLCSGAKLPERGAWGTTIPVIIAGSDQRAMAIAIDDVKQALELVIRSLGSQFASVPGLAGGATTTDGQAIVALDLNALVESMGDEPQSLLSIASEVRERMLVFVVDDSRTQRMVATSQFDKLGVETVTAENGLIAIDLLNNSHRLPDVILLDIEMPVKDGIQTLREIRKSPRLSDIPVIMVTSRTGAKHRRLAEEAGCNDFMGKPFNFPLLVQRINALTGHELHLD
jgi:chemosensory pili system protein ChpA (sensor histidine kinase/response regulator)